MEQVNNILTPAPNKYITQFAEIPIESRIVASLVVLSPNASIDHWREISAEEAAVIRAKQRQLVEDKIKQMSFGC